MPVFTLSIHADYTCAHSGACCTAGWAIPVEPPKRRALGASVLVPESDGTCRFFDRGTHLCAIHRDAGERALPETCRHFPRVALTDDRGVHVTLSHFCPTAARQLFRDDVPLMIVEAPPAFPPWRDYEGLDARGAWPPLIHDARLFDRDGYAAWERFVVSALAAGDSSLALGRISTAAERLRAWMPGDEPLDRAIERLDTSYEIDEAAAGVYKELPNAVVIVTSSVPDALRRSSVPPRADQAWRAAASRSALQSRAATRSARRPADDAVVCRYLAAKAFASWTAYQGGGIRTLVAELLVADALVSELATSRTLLEAIREADRLLVHLADRRALVRAIGSVENRPVVRRSPDWRLMTDD